MATQVGLFAALLFVVVSSQVVYKLTNAVTSKVIGLRLSDAAGNPTRAGVVLHAVVFFAAMYFFGREMRL